MLFCIALLTVESRLCTFCSLHFRTLHDNCCAGRATLRSMSDILNSAVGSSTFIISPYSMSYRYRTQFLWISIFILLYCEHIFFLAGLVSQKGSQLALEECLEPSCYDSSSKLARSYPVLLAEEQFFTSICLVHSHTSNFHCPTSWTNHISSCVVCGRTYREAMNRVSQISYTFSNLKYSNHLYCGRWPRIACRLYVSL
jgi:hypothetical protein